MSDFEESPSPRSDDFAEHLERIRQLPNHANTALQQLFAPQLPIRVAWAPGRLDIMGGIGDYSGSLVLELPIAETAFAAVQASANSEIRVVSLSQDKSESHRFATIDGCEFSRWLQSDYSTIHEEFKGDSNRLWAAYVLGPILTLLKETGTHLSGGLRILIDSQVPEGKGVSSSAAVEVATMRAVAAMLRIDLVGEELARLCQWAENHVVGAPCGLMDQMTSALGRKRSLLALRCQPDIVEEFLPIPNELTFWGIDSGIRHAVTGSDYNSVRCGAFMGYCIITDVAGLPAKRGNNSSDVYTVDDPQWHGYLANISPAEYQQRFASIVPEDITGREFLARYGGTTDRVTRLEPDRTYAVQFPTLHPIEENARAERFRTLLKSPVTEQSLLEMGQLMAAAHASYTACGLGSTGTDKLVNLVMEAGPGCGLYGAKITGGGSGGSIAVLGRSNAGPAVERIAAQYTAETGLTTYVFRGSSPGAYRTPVAEVII